MNLVSLMRRDMKMSKEAVDCVFAHGQVYLDGRCLFNDERSFPAEEVAGKMLRVGQREMRVGGSRRSETAEPIARLESVEPMSETLF